MYEKIRIIAIEHPGKLKWRYLSLHKKQKNELPPTHFPTCLFTMQKKAMQLIT